MARAVARPQMPGRTRELIPIVLTCQLPKKTFRELIVALTSSTLPPDDVAKNMNLDASAKTTRHILVVDDDQEIVASIATTLEGRGYQISKAYDGNQAIAYAELKKPDVIVLDLMMPRRSGFLVLERLRQNVDTQMPVIMITGNEGERHRKYAQLLGVNDYILKPFTMDRLLQSISKILD